MSSAAKFVIAMPSRNRETIAIKSLASIEPLLAEADIAIVVSDNSDEPGTQLRAHCEAMGIGYIRPPEPLPMSRHWDWILRSVDWSAITLMSDRMFLLPGRYLRMKALASETGRAVVWDAADAAFRSWLGQPYWVLSSRRMSRRVYRVREQDLIANLKTILFDRSLPGLLKAITHRHEWEAVCKAFPTTLSSNNPDSEFAYKYIHLFEGDSHTFVDDVVSINHSGHVSNSAGTAAPEKSSTFQDHVRLNNITRFEHSPWPNDLRSENAILNECNKVYVQMGRGWLFDEAAARALPPLWKSVLNKPLPARRIDNLRNLLGLGDEFLRMGLGDSFADMDAERVLQRMRPGPAIGPWGDGGELEPTARGGGSRPARP